MSYIKSALVADEQIMYQGHFHWIQKVAAIVGIFRIISMWSTDRASANRCFIYKRGWIAPEDRRDESVYNDLREIP